MESEVEMEGGKAPESGAMTPWEQHSAVISIPRFDYTAPVSLLETPRAGFLVTCPIKREKSATKEAISILEKHITYITGKDPEILEPSVVPAEKKRKTDTTGTEGMPETDEKDAVSTSNSGGTTNLSLVKLIRNGLVLFTFPPDNCINAVHIVGKVLRSLENGDHKKPLWCHRIFPIQKTCTLEEKPLFDLVSKLVQQFIDNDGEKLEKPVKFAVGYDRRGFDETEKTLRAPSNENGGLHLLDRDECFKVVAKAVKLVAADSVVDLKSPKLVILVELLPISGLRKGPALAGVSVLSHELVSTKPRLCVKTLLSSVKPDAKPK